MDVCEMSSYAEASAPSSTTPEKAPRTGKTKKTKTANASTTDPRTGKKSLSKKKSKKPSHGKKSSSVLSDVQKAFIRQQDEVRAGVALLTQRFRAGLYFWPLATYPLDRTGTCDRFFVQDVVMPVPNGSEKKKKKKEKSLLPRSSDAGDTGEEEEVEEVVVDQGRDYVAQARAETAALARRFQDGLLAREGEEKVDGYSDRGHRGRLPRLANAGKTITVYRLQDVIDQRERGDATITTTTITTTTMTTTRGKREAATAAVSRPVRYPSSLVSSTSSRGDDDDDADHGSHGASETSPSDEGCCGSAVDVVSGRDAQREWSEQGPDGDEEGGPVGRDADEAARSNQDGAEDDGNDGDKEELDFGLTW